MQAGCLGLQAGCLGLQGGLPGWLGEGGAGGRRVGMVRVGGAGVVARTALESSSCRSYRGDIGEIQARYRGDISEI